jgi:hypothetical protein
MKFQGVDIMQTDLTERHLLDRSTDRDGRRFILSQYIIQANILQYLSSL